MEDIIKNLVEKISSYDILNNLFPGVIFCSIVERTTRITFSTGEIWEDLFLYYFAGMIISRIGSIFIEKILKSIKVRNKKTKEKDKFLKFAPYCIFRKNRALAPHERSAVPLGTDHCPVC